MWQEELQDKAVVVIRRVRDKLTGLDFAPPRGSRSRAPAASVAGASARPGAGARTGEDTPSRVAGQTGGASTGGTVVQGGREPGALDVAQQVDRLIVQATSNENLCLSFVGWCPFW